MRLTSTDVSELITALEYLILTADRGQCEHSTPGATHTWRCLASRVLRLTLIFVITFDDDYPILPVEAYVDGFSIGLRDFDLPGGAVLVVALDAVGRTAASGTEGSLGGLVPLLCADVSTARLVTAARHGYTTADGCGHHDRDPGCSCCDGNSFPHHPSPPPNCCSGQRAPSNLNPR